MGPARHDTLADAAPQDAYVGATAARFGIALVDAARLSIEFIGAAGLRLNDTLAMAARLDAILVDTTGRHARAGAA